LFNDILNFDGVILTKLDGDTRGAAISLNRVVDKPIKFIGTGEKMDAIDVFFIQHVWPKRILGMGDVVSFVERAQSNTMKTKLQKNPKEKLLKTNSVLTISFPSNQKMGSMQRSC
jgi:signal recognition particle subunit SRP54